ncbi:hypothetical protein X777_06625, partial [Ooceraea biroi]
LWPYQKGFICRMQAVFVFSACWQYIFSAFLTTTCNMDCILKRFSYICLSFVFILCYCSLYFNSEVIKQLLKHVQLDWKMSENSDTIKVFEEYLSLSFVFTLFVIMIVPMSLFVVMSVKCKPVILDAIIPLNVSRPRKIETDYEFFLDKQEYFFLYIIQEVLAMSIGFFSALIPGTFSVTLIRHFCATYKIASCLIQNTAIVHTLQILVTQEMQFMHRRICLSIYIHRRTFTCVKSYMHSVDLWYSPLLLICVLSLSCLLFRLLTTAVSYFTVLHTMHL